MLHLYNHSVTAHTASVNSLKGSLNTKFATLDHQAERGKRCLQLIASESSAEPLMLRCMKVLGIGLVNAFALLAAIGEIGRFNNPAKRVTHAGLSGNPPEDG